MYIVELRPGKEELYRTVDELTAAIHRGDVTWQSRVYHRAALRWLPITLHPHFRKVAGERRAEPPQRLPRADWTFHRAEAPPESLAAELALRKAQEVEKRSRPGGTPTKSKSDRSWGRLLGGLIGQNQT